MWRKNRTKRKGFTLVELLVVIVILAMLSGIVAPKFFAQIEKARYDSCRAKMTPIESAIDTFLLNTNTYPASLEELVVDPGLAGWAGPYLKESQLYDPWDRPYIYNMTNDGYELISYAADGVQGGEGYGADIVNY
jgi:general secretion pathway protein G